MQAKNNFGKRTLAAVETKVAPATLDPPNPIRIIFGFVVILALIGLKELIWPTSADTCWWGTYLCLGVCALPALLGVEIGLRKMPSKMTFPCGIGVLAALCGAAGFAPFAADIWIACCFAALAWLLTSAARGSLSFSLPTTRSWMVLLVGCVAWTTHLRMMGSPSWDAFVFDSPQRTIITFLTLVAAVIYWSAEAPAPSSRSMLWRVWPDLAAISVMIMTAFITPSASTIEQDFFIGPALLVREGAHLLWDVPSQYGFLNILLMAALPFSDMHLSLYVFNAITLIAIQLVLYGLLRMRGGSTLHVLVSLLLTVSTIFQLSTWGTNRLGPQLVPSIGGMRYLFCYLFLAYTWWNMREPVNGQRSAGKRLIAGSLLWTCAFLWSAESALYTASIWFPQAMALAFAMAGKAGGTLWRSRLPRTLGFFVFSLAPLLLVIIVVSLIYLMGIGHLPDGYSFVEFALVFKNGSGFMAVDPAGGVWWLILLFSVFSAVLIDSLYRRGLAASAPIAGLWALFFTSSSYFVARSAESNIITLTALDVTCLATLFAGYRSRGTGLRTLLAPIMVPLTVLALAPLFATNGLSNYAAALLESSPAQKIQSQLPMITEQVRLVLARGGYKTGGALTQINDRLSPPLLDPTHPPELVYEGLHGFWLPLAPASAFMVLRAERQQIYLERFAAAHPSGGWMLTTKAGYWGHDLGESLAQFLTKTHKITSTTEDSDFVLIRYDPR